jgi:hypothetical protein
MTPRQASARAQNLAQLQAQELTTRENAEQAGLIESSAESGAVVLRRLNREIRQPRSIRRLQLIVQHDAVQMVVHTRIPGFVALAVECGPPSSAGYPAEAGANGGLVPYSVTTVPTLRLSRHATDEPGQVSLLKAT